MFDKLRAAFREAVDNFKTELNRDRIPEAVDSLAQEMYREATEAKAYVNKLEKELAATHARAKEESEQAQICRRRGSQALRIGDEETVRIAEEFAVKHDQRTQVLETKAEAILSELTVCRADLDEMLAQIRNARREGDRLAATAGRTQARDSLGKADDLFSDFDRMGERVTETESESEAFRDFDRELGVEPDRTPDDLNERLRALKRQMRDN